MDLAGRHLESGRQTSEQILAEVRARLHLLEEGEELRFQQEAEHRCRQLMQSARLRIDAELDRLRWTLIQGVLAELDARLARLVDDRARYRVVLGRYLAEAAQAIPAGKLVAELSPRDVEWIRPDWAALTREAAPGREVELKALPDAASGGMRVADENGSKRIDNTFAGRRARLESELLHVIMETLFAGAHAGEAAAP
jgi:V/A-type H+-transporting ATPase subunit E